jgi:prepilin-type N-terminal cleavage/methylation domain-containing protein
VVDAFGMWYHGFRHLSNIGHLRSSNIFMRTQKGFTIIELLVVVGIIGLLASLAVVSFGSAQARARDGKRSADMRAVVSAFTAAAAAEGPAASLCNGTNAIAADVALDALLIKNGSCAAGTDVTTQYIGLSRVLDPQAGTGALCAGNPSGPCRYTVRSGSTLTNFTIGFGTESATVPNLAAGNAHTARPTGIQ